MWSWRRKHKRHGFPDGFRIQRIGITAAREVCGLPPGEIAGFFRRHLETATALLHESKRFTPSTFIKEDDDAFRVGWFTRDAKYECVQEFDNLADAATDYLLFSLGKGRWNSHSSLNE